MTTHLSARLTWHDSGWNGRICQAPALNADVMEHEHVREGRDLTFEGRTGLRTRAAKAETGYLLPPCSRDTNAFGAETYVLRHRDPVPGRGLPQ